MYRYQPTPLRSLDLGGGWIGQRRCIFPAGVGIQPGRWGWHQGGRGTWWDQPTGLRYPAGTRAGACWLSGSGRRLHRPTVLRYPAGAVAVPWQDLGARLNPGASGGLIRLRRAGVQLAPLRCPGGRGWYQGGRLNPAAGWDIVKRSARRRAKFCGALRLFSFSLSL